MEEEPTRAEVRLRVRELMGRATLLRARQRPEEALEVARQAVELDPESYETHELVGDLLLELRRGQPALESFRRAQELNPGRVVLEDKVARAALAQAEAARVAEQSQALLSGAAHAERPKRNPGYAALLSLLLPGLGQVYNGELVKGLVVLFVFVFIFAFAVLAGLRDLAAAPPAAMGTLYGPRLNLMSLLSGISAVWLALLLGVWIYAVADASIRASRTLTSDDSGLV